MNDESPSTVSSLPRRRLRVAAAAAWALAGFLLAVLILVDPLGLHPLNERWLGTAAGDAAAAHEHTGLWTCGMHPQVIQDQPGQCPICHMDLVPLRMGDGTPATADRQTPVIWTCPKHPMIEETEPGECPIDGRPLVPKRRGAEPGTAAGERKVLFYRNPMDPSVTSPVPAKDRMGMDYVAVYADQAGQAAGQGPVVRIDPAVVQNMNVRTEPVMRRDLERHIRTVGSLEYDQQRMVTVTTKYAGWIEKVYVNYIGEPVRKGEPLFEIYSPQLVQTEQELLSAVQFAQRMANAPEGSRKRAEDLVEATRTRLGYWDISADQTAELERTGEVFRTLTVSAPASGVIMKRMDGLEGMAVQPGMQTFHIANLSSLWLSVDVFEDQLAWIHEGTPAKVTFTYFPGEIFRGTVRYLEPELSEATRTLKVKLEVPNPGGRLRAGMFATVIFAPLAVKDAVTVPSLAVLRTGERNLVVVALGGGRFAPREVTLGLEREGWAEVLEGLEEGEEVVTSAQFLLDSESSLQEAIQKMIAQAGDGR
jgi:membrane fusion protein, copper/silver efflux system